MKTSKNIVSRLVAGARAHKIWATIIVLVIVFGGYYIVKAARGTTTTTSYTISPAMKGDIRQTVSGSGQVAASNQLDVTSQASGAITSIKVKIGQEVHAGDILATIDNTAALNSLTSARISYAKTTEPAKAGDVTNAQNSMNKSYSDAGSTLRDTYSDLKTVMTGMDDMYYGTGGYLSTAKSVYLTTTSQGYRQSAAARFDDAKRLYADTLVQYEKLSTTSGTSSVETLLLSTSNILTRVASALKDLQNTLLYINANEPTYNSANSTAANSDVNSWISTTNGDLSSVGSAKNSIDSNRNSLTNVLQGADDLDRQSAELSLRQAQDAYDKYFVRAPFDGIVGRIPVSIYSQAGSGTVISTIVGKQKVANISLDEVDAAKVREGQPVTITFDAADDLTATGTVTSVDLVGTVSQGVVSYTVKIAIDTQNDRIRPGMSMNVTIITNEKKGVLIVPASAVKTQGNRSYVEVAEYTPTQMTTAGRTASSTRTGMNGTNMASTTGRFAGFTGMGSIGVSFTGTVTSVPVVVGMSDDTNTEIVSGLEARQWVVTRTTNGASTATAAPSILNAIGGNRAGGAVRAGGGAAAGANRTFAR